VTDTEHYERFIEEVIRRATGLEVEHVDDGSRPRMFDALIRYPDGREAALEMTTVGDRAVMQMRAFPQELEIPTTPHWWDFRYPPTGVRRRDIERHVPKLIEWLDQFDVADAENLPSFLRVTEEARWYESAGVKLRRFGHTSKGGRVDILPDSWGGGVDEKLRTLADWIEELQLQPWWADNVAKVAASGRDELHLALRVHDSGAPFPIWSGLWDPEEVTSRDPNGMAPLTDLWLVGGQGTTVVRWSRGEGWRIHRWEDPI
jgi:hypothetical protein